MIKVKKKKKKIVCLIIITKSNCYSLSNQWIILSYSIWIYLYLSTWKCCSSKAHLWYILWYGPIDTHLFCIQIHAHKLYFIYIAIESIIQIQILTHSVLSFTHIPIYSQCNEMLEHIQSNIKWASIWCFIVTEWKCHIGIHTDKAYLFA